MNKRHRKSHDSHALRKLDRRAFLGMSAGILCTAFLGACGRDNRQAAVDKSVEPSQEAGHLEPLTVYDKETAAQTVQQKEPELSNAEKAEKLKAEYGIQEDYRKDFDHGDKSAPYQKYIVFHDTEVNGSPTSVIDGWDHGDRHGVAAHFVIGKDGSIVQCIPLDRIGHHAGFGDKGQNVKFGVEDESRDDKKGTVSRGKRYPDYGMNSYSVGIELVHVTAKDSGYPEAQLQSLDKVVNYIDTYFGFESQIIDHKMWRTTNSDMSKAFDPYMKNYLDHRSYQ